MTLKTGMLLGILAFLLATSVTAYALATPEEQQGRDLGRAIDLWLSGDIHGAAAHLEKIEIGRESTTPAADRAAFLLAAAYLHLGDRDALVRVVDVAADSEGSSWRRWVAYLGLLEAGGEASAIDGFAGSEILAAARHLQAGRPQQAHDLLDEENDPASLHLRSVAAVALGQDARGDLERLAQLEADSQVEADLIGAAILTLAGDDLAVGGDPLPRLSEMPSVSVYAARGLHLAALVFLAEGDSVSAERMLGELVSRHPGYAEHRMALLESGAMAGASGNWAMALEQYEEAESDFAKERGRLETLLEPAGVETAWTIWEDQWDWRQEIRLESGAARLALKNAVAVALDWNTGGDPDRPSALGDGDPSRSDSPAFHDQPTSEQWHGVRTLRGELASAQVDAADQAWRLQGLADDRSRRENYLDLGQMRATSSADTLAAAVARLDIMLARMDIALNNLDSARDQALVRFGTRCRTMAAELRRNLLYLEAVRHFHIDGPEVDPTSPSGIPSMAGLLTVEADLALEMESFLTTFDVRSEDLVTRSHALVWRPRLQEQSPALRAALASELSRAHLAVAGIDVERERLANDPAWRNAVAHHAALTARADSLAVAHQDLKMTVAAEVAARGMERLDTEREAIALHAADASFWLAVAGDHDDDPSGNARSSRTAALQRHQDFLEDHPEAAARSEVRFRLADLHLMQARDDFRVRMADFLGENPTADDLQDRGLAPFVDTAPAVALYGAILAEDPGYAHREAVLFSLGMILADDGNSEGETRLAELVREHPQSTYVQEAWLRLGDAGFDRRDLAACREAYGHASRGEDLDLKAIAYYKLGWARFEDDMFAEAADAFGALMDHGVPDGSDRAPQDLTREAEEYLVRSLVRAGGAEAFRDHFQRHGDRPYAADILHDMSRLDRRFSLYAEAVACDELWLARYGTDPRALEVAERLVDSNQLGERPEAALDALLAQAPRFLAGSEWHTANADEELQIAGRTFAQEAYRTAATRSHQAARDTDAADDWRKALEHYETWLDHWDSDAAAARLHYQAGEAAAQLGRHEAAIGHFTRAAAADTGDFVLDASWQTVAVTDAWYEEAKVDSLAQRLLTVGDVFLADHPADDRAADLRWRAGNVAYAHGWHERAAATFTSFETEHPQDARTPDAARLVADAWYQHPDLPKAGRAYEHALNLARAAGRDSMATVLAATVPLVHFQHAEAVAADSTRNTAEAAPLFLTVADRWPGFDHADLALYRAGLGFAEDLGSQAVAAWERLLENYPESPYDRDASLEVARLHEQAGRGPDAAAAYERFSHRHPDDPDAAEAQLMAIDLSVGDPTMVRRREDDFVTRFAGQAEQVMVIRQGWALTALAAGETAAGQADLTSYLAAAAIHPELADPRILAEVDYREAEEAFMEYQAVALTQPLSASLEIKKAQLEEVIGLYNRCVQREVRELSHASAHRIGAAIVHFGDALTASERPADLAGDDLAAYEEVLEEQGWSFYARGEEAWNQLLKQNRDSEDDPGAWIARTQEALWPRVAQHFMHQPEVEYPLVAAVAPQGALETPEVRP